MTDEKDKKVNLKAGKQAYREKIVPVLHLSGLWLEELGFKAGGQVVIIIEENQLTIKPLC